MSFRTTPWWAAPAFALALFVTACGGGGGGSSNGGGGGGGGGGDTPAAATVSGTAAVGAALQNASISLLCNDGRANTATAGADGKYSLTLPSDCAAPYLLRATGQVNGATVTLYAYADAKGNINLTTFSTLVAGAASPGSDLAAVYAAIASGSQPVGATWTGSTAGSAMGQVGQLLTALLGGAAPPSVTAAWLNQAFNAAQGDAFDGLLEQFKTALGGASIDSLLEQFAQAGGSPGYQPWRVLFGTQGTRVFTGTDCIYSGSTSASLGTTTFTLTRKSNGVRVDVAGTLDTTHNGGFDLTTDAGMRWSMTANATSSFVVLLLDNSGNLFNYDTTGTYTQPLRMYITSSALYACTQVASAALTPATLNHFDPVARIGKLLGNQAGGPKTCGTSPSTYSFSNTAVGVVQSSLAGGGALPADWLLQTGGSYSETAAFPGYPTGPAQISLTYGSTSNVMSLRQLNGSPNLNCSRQTVF
ncbi:hypothetical protein [Variovorax terrae]|uniref:Carboxypeptidase regulatory-like domain-containing protein n=1 Tax=Variovorax terrae TaxID=2923278 RepID=A0A9X2ARY6_9BURK|nr:hypothetical protein [Variovorax terrae]MCJ0764661.1 hypothetical protein [Variovorax terrae]